MQHLKSSIDKFTDGAKKQEDKGVTKYGQPLDPLDKNYDWLEMAIEEQVDGFKYLHAEQVKRKHITDQIRLLIKNNTISMVHDQITVLLDQLEGKDPYVKRD